MGGRSEGAALFSLWPLANWKREEPVDEDQSRSRSPSEEAWEGLLQACEGR